MDELKQYLVELANRLDIEDKTLCANAVDQLIENNSLTKVAQYVGAIGYVLKQNRAMGNCVRKKRSASSQPMQQIVLECLKEYQDGQDYHDTEWHSKYAQTIVSSPDSFQTSHLELVDNIRETENIAKHIKEVEDVALLLHTNDVKDDVFIKVLSQLETLDGLLRKDADSPRPFELAAAASPRNSWSRFWTPSEFSWWNPMSWKGRWQGGEDKDVMVEMERILENIRDITLLTQKMKTNIHRLQNQVAGYLSGSTTDLPDTESNNIISSVSQKIGQLDPTDWNKNLLALQQLRFFLGNNQIQNNYNQESMNLAFNLTDDVYQGINQVYKYIDQIQNNMNTMRQRAPIRGRDTGLTEQGKPNPFGMSSPSEEFGVLEKVLAKLYENPFDDRANYYAQRMHARLDDRLRYVSNKPDEDASEWLKSTPDKKFPIINPEIPQTTEEHIDVDVDNKEEEINSPIQHDKVEEVTEQLLNIDAPFNDKANKPEWLARLINHISNYALKNRTDKSTQEFLQQIMENLISKQNKPHMPRDQNTTSPTTNQPPSVETTKKVDSILEQVPAVVTQPKPQKTTVVEKAVSPHGGSKTQRYHSTKSSRGGRTPLPLLRPVDTGEQEVSAGSVFDLIKIADVLDNSQPKIVDLIDNYLAEQENLMFKLPEFPNKAEAIKENDYQQLTI